MTTLNPPRTKSSQLNSFQPASDLLSSAQGVPSNLRQQLAALTQLQVAWQQVIPQSLLDHVIPIATSGNKLTLGAESSVWATTIRHTIPQILSKLQQAGYPQLQQIGIRIIPQQFKRTQIVRRTKPSADTQQKFQDSAQSIEDLELREALLKLGKTLKAD